MYFQQETNDDQRNETRIPIHFNPRNFAKTIIKVSQFFWAQIWPSAQQELNRKIAIEEVKEVRRNRPKVESLKNENFHIFSEFFVIIYILSEIEVQLKYSWP